MNCLHEKPAASSTTSNGSFWFCGQNPTCNFFCAEDEGYMYEKAITAWRCTEQPHPRCDEHRKLAKMCVVKDLMKVNYGRPFFVCGEKAKPCSFWMWGDVQPLAKPECRHGFPCVIRKVKKEGLNKDRLFFCCPNDKENTCRFFEWVPEEQSHAFYQNVNFVKPLLKKSSLEKPEVQYLASVEVQNERDQEVSLFTGYCTRNPDGTCDGDPRGHLHPF